MNKIYFSLISGYQIIKDSPTFYSSDPIDPKYLLIRPPTENKLFYFSPKVAMLFLDSTLIPSVYGKLSKSTLKNTTSEMKINESLGGFGADLTFNFNNQFNLYFGYSKFDDLTYQTDVNLLEMRLSYCGESYNVVLNAFNKKFKSIKTSGIALGGYFKYWKILFEGRMSQYFFEQGNMYESLNLPETKFSFGIYFNDSLFNSNLDLK